MLECGILNSKNVYVPNLQDIYESAKRQAGEGNSFFKMAESQIKKSVSEQSKEIIYDDCNAIASCLAFACESYLKAIYIYENNISGNNIGDLWKNLRFPRKIDPSRSKDVKGHDIDILIENLSTNTRNLIETRLCTIPMNDTDKFSSVSIFDLLQQRNIIKMDNSLAVSQYTSWLEEHKRAFEEARYGGEIYRDFNIEFLYHLATQIKAVAEYMIVPKVNQNFTINLDSISNLPEEIKKLYRINNKLISEQLIELVTQDKDKMQLLVYIVNNNEYINNLVYLNASNFYELILKFDMQEIILMLSTWC